MTIIDMTSTAPTRTPSADEVERLDRLAATWWNGDGPMPPLPVIHELRLDYLLEQIAIRFGRATGDLSALCIADIGCGAGPMRAALAARGAQVVGVDAAALNVVAAEAHAGAAVLTIDDRVGAPEYALHADDVFDVLLLLEVVEHVDDVRAFLAEAAGHLAPGGLLIASTINRTSRSFMTVIVGAEYVFGVTPRGTHRWAKFVRPDELSQAARACGLEEQDRRGMRYPPVTHRARWTRDLSINYIASFIRV